MSWVPPGTLLMSFLSQVIVSWPHFAVSSWQASSMALKILVLNFASSSWELERKLKRIWAVGTMAWTASKLPAWKLVTANVVMGSAGTRIPRSWANGSGRRMERVCHLSKHAARMAADSVEVHLIRLDACGLISDLLVAGSVHRNAGLQLRMMVHIILHSL